MESKIFVLWCSSIFFVLSILWKFFACCDDFLLSTEVGYFFFNFSSTIQYVFEDESYEVDFPSADVRMAE